jgi:hypothetical protein
MQYWTDFKIKEKIMENVVCMMHSNRNRLLD